MRLTRRELPEVLRVEYREFDCYRMYKPVFKKLNHT